jgi:hypothetical protein
MVTTPGEKVDYRLPIGEHEVAVNPLLGQSIQLRYSGEIRCLSCGRRTKKSFNQGHCYVCFRSLARCDTCIMRPEECHYEQGTCREPEWAQGVCLIPHTVYLANTGKIKVGITRGGNESVRWVDQGATQALAIRTVPTRLASGEVEVALKAHVGDRTNWRVMLSGSPDPVDLPAARDRIMGLLQEALPSLPGSLVDAQPREFVYPVLRYPDKVRSHNLDKSPLVEGTLQGIKGQYLILDTGVINMRKYGGYVLELSAS